jgi:hypothetical protein
LTVLIARKNPRRHARVAARWLLRYLEERDDVTIEEAAMAASCLAGDGLRLQARADSALSPARSPPPEDLALARAGFAGKRSRGPSGARKAVRVDRHLLPRDALDRGASRGLSCAPGPCRCGPGVVPSLSGRRRPRPHFSWLSGEGGIRTLEGGYYPLNALAGRRLQPLGHFSSARAGYRKGFRLPVRDTACSHPTGRSGPRGCRAP